MGKPTKPQILNQTTRDMVETSRETARKVALNASKKVLSKRNSDKDHLDSDNDDTSFKRPKRELVSIQASHDDHDDEENDDSEDVSDEDSDDESEESDDGEEVDDDNASSLRRHTKSLAASMSAQSGRKALLSKHIQKQLEQKLIEQQYRHLMNEMHTLLPHSKKDAKLDSKSHLEDLNELAELNNCNNCLYFEVRKHQDMYLWMSKTPNGPSVKFMVRNVHTMDELKMTGNCLKGSRPVLSFDKTFDLEPHLQLLKEMFTQTFAVPRTSRKIKPFIDHIMSFSILDNKIWLRNFQIIEKIPEKGLSKEPEISLVEIGPRCVLDIIRIFDGSFGGSTLYENTLFVSPNELRRNIKAEINAKHQGKAIAQEEREKKKLHNLPAPDPMADVFI
ncbi:hypothetical protein BDEG_22732 [Batrachochytrium dendrobatidis JEL423]|uniref:Brix domain-containing protein n=1 Tax=Batrachochytrium dendrobatidis (strain JEL423) TaxID=403673 RepID=A0A177WFN3_BATDL|nr:hypothetical protein BDEG_22732 [Batrachochytrium dendrobatidis JEL423]